MANSHNNDLQLLEKVDAEQRPYADFVRSFTLASLNNSGRQNNADASAKLVSSGILPDVKLQVAESDLIAY